MCRNKRENIWQISGESHHRDLRLQSASLIASKVVFACVHASIANEMDFYLQQIINSEIHLTWKNGFIVPMVQKKISKWNRNLQSYSYFTSTCGMH